MREYECMLILPAEADEAMVGTAVGRIEKIVTPAGGAIGNIDRWGRRRFAYEIAHQNEGYYVLVRFTAEPSTQAEIDRTLKLADEVTRHKVLVLPAKAPAKASEKAKAAASPASDSEA